MNVISQFAVALATTFARPDGPDGNPGSSLAVGFLAAMLGFGLNGLWASRYGVFVPRRELAREQGESEPQSVADVPASGEEIGQNADHG